MNLFSKYLDSISNRNPWTNNITKILILALFFGSMYVENDFLCCLMFVLAAVFAVCLGVRNKTRGE